MCVLTKVEDDKLRVLVSHLLDHPLLAELDLSYNVIGDRGARALGKLVNGRSQLTRLSLPNNNVQTAGALALAHALTRNTTLLCLDLRLNHLGDDGAKVADLTKLSPRNSRPISLFLSLSHSLVIFVSTTYHMHVALMLRA